VLLLMIAAEPPCPEIAWDLDVDLATPTPVPVAVDNPPEPPGPGSFMIFGPRELVA
jgi:hypothetical protein